MQKTKPIRIQMILHENVVNLREKIFERLINLGREGYKVKLESIGLHGFFGYLLGLGIASLVSKTDTDEKLIAKMSHL
ncbi:MAG: hypothetical protein ACW98X_17835 [Promethearchaeota archaeon]|jgi:hypothetical protein